MIKKFYTLIPAILSCFIMVSMFSGCSRQQNSTKDADQAVTGKPAMEPLTLPIVKEKLTLTCFMGLDPKAAATMQSLNDVASYKELEKRTNIHIDFWHPPVGQENDQLNLRIASGDLPDLIFSNWPNYVGGPAKALQDGTIIKLNEYIDAYAPNYKGLLDKRPLIRKQAALDDGTLYSFPTIRLLKDRDDFYKDNGFQMRKDWLDKLGLQPPKTIDELYRVLKAFREKDPNGNGNPNDEIPFVSSKESGIKSLSSAWGVVSGFYQENGKVKFGPIEPAYKDYLAVMNQWYKEKLIDQEYAMTDGKMFDSKITGNKGGFYHGQLSGSLARFLTLMADKDPKFDILPLGWPVGPAGKPYTSISNYNKLVTGEGKAVTNKNKHIKESIKWMDYLYSDEGSKLFNFGIEGESYTMVNGIPKYTDLVLKSPKGLPMDQAVTQYCMSVATDAMIKEEQAFVQRALLLPQQRLAQDVWMPADQSLLLPAVTPTQEESSKVASIINEANTYVDEMFNKFVMNQEPLDNYDKYVKNIKNMGIDEVIKIYQTALERYNKR